MKSQKYHKATSEIKTLYNQDSLNGVHNREVPLNHKWTTVNCNTFDLEMNRKQPANNIPCMVAWLNMIMCGK